MKQILVLPLFILVLLFSCKEKKQTGTANVTDNKIDNTAQSFAKDSAEIRQTILSFYNWYNGNYARLQKFELYKGQHPPYKMNWPEVDRMHQFIRDSVPQLGSAFIKNQKTFLLQSDSAFKVDVEDDIPYGFDWDWYTNSQEDPQYTLDEIKKSDKWIYNIKGDEATVEIKGSYNDNGKQTETTVLKLLMARENGSWKIAKIGE